MEVYKGSLQGSNFQKWLEGLMKNQRNKIVIVADDISCYEVKLMFPQSVFTPYPHIVTGMKRALIHLMVCQNRQCQQFFKSLTQKVS